MPSPACAPPKQVQPTDEAELKTRKLEKCKGNYNIILSYLILSSTEQEAACDIRLIHYITPVLVASMNQFCYCNYQLPADVN